MASALAIPQNLSFFHPNHFGSRIFIPTNVNHIKFPPKKIYSKLSPLDSNGVALKHCMDDNCPKALQPFRVLGTPSKFSYSDRTFTVKSTSSDSGITSTSLQNKVIYMKVFLVLLSPVIWFNCFRVILDHWIVAFVGFSWDHSGNG